MMKTVSYFINQGVLNLNKKTSTQESGIVREKT